LELFLDKMNKIKAENAIMEPTYCTCLIAS
jgi:hypothetical protein